MHILLVDDEDHSRQFLARFLRECGHIVFEAAEGDAALEIVKISKPNLVLSDNKMPGMFGVDLFQKICDLQMESPPRLVLFTAFNDENTILQALKHGADDYLVKPIDIEELLATIDKSAGRNGDKAKAVKSTVSRKTNEPDQRLPHQITITSSIMQDIYNLARRLHLEPSIPVLIEGETGTGKEVLALFIHTGDEQLQAPFVAINCAALSPHVFESELFGYEAGSFTGASVKGQKGKLDIARSGTLFLDEISEIPIKLQAKLLRLIEERKFYRVGGLVEINTDARIICSSNRNLDHMIARGLFRQDLYYRLNVAHIYIPPLRERREEIVPLAQMFLQSFASQKAKAFCSIDRSAAKMLQEHDWPGNVRELRNLMERVVLIHDDSTLKACHLDISRSPVVVGWEKASLASRSQANKSGLPLALPPDRLPLEALVDEIVLRALEMHGGNKTETARYLDISRSVLHYRLNKMK